MTVLRVRPAAERDVDDAGDYYARESNIDLALRFFGAVEQAYGYIVQHPHAGSPVMAFNPRLAGLRFWPVAGFEKHLVFYLLTSRSVEIVRVLHGARDLVRILEEPVDE